MEVYMNSYSNNSTIIAVFQGEDDALGADDLTTERGIDQVRNPADVIDVGMGEKQKVDLCRRHREPVEGHLRVMVLGNAAVHQDGDAAAAVVRLKLDQVTQVSAPK